MLNPTVKRYLVSTLTTFLSVFLTTLGAQIAVAGTIEPTFAFAVSVLMVAARAGIKAAVEAVPTFGSADKLS